MEILIRWFIEPTIYWSILDYIIVMTEIIIICFTAYYIWNFVQIIKRIIRKIIKNAKNHRR